MATLVKSRNKLFENAHLTMSKLNRKITIYDLAKLSGASASTVSAALSGAWRKRRIKESTAKHIQALAEENGYKINMQARGLRQAKSGMVGMILPVHDNRFFSSLSQSFEARARERGLCPVVVSTLRDPKEERQTVEALLSYSIDALFIAGATDPDALSEICAKAGLNHVHIDLPGKTAPSIVSNNFRGAQILTQQITSSMSKTNNPLRDKVYFLGGEQKDYATSRRIEGFKTTLMAQKLHLSDEQIIASGYAPNKASQEIQALCERIGGLPAALFVNSLTVFEGVLNYFLDLPRDAFQETNIGCYDYDPFAAFLHFPVYMVRQNADKLIASGFELIDQGNAKPCLIEIEPDLIMPRTIYEGPFAKLG